MGIVLIGYRGSGKTTVGRRLAARLGQPFFDSDETVTAAAGMTISEMFQQHGEPHFRALEAAAVRELATRRDAVIALGGGAILRDDSRAAIRAGEHHVVYLRADAATLHDRIHADTAATRPALTHLGGTQAEIEQLLASRAPIYRAAMTCEIDVAGKSVEQIVDQLMELT